MKEILVEIAQATVALVVITDFILRGMEGYTAQL